MTNQVGFRHPDMLEYETGNGADAGSPVALAVLENETAEGETAVGVGSTGTEEAAENTGADESAGGIESSGRNEMAGEGINGAGGAEAAAPETGTEDPAAGAETTGNGAEGTGTDENTGNRPDGSTGVSGNVVTATEEIF